MKIAIGCDHGGYIFKGQIIEKLKKEGYDVLDCGTHSLDSCDYPIFAEAVARAVSNKEVEYGIILCKSGEGVSMAANRVKGCRCGIAYNDEVAALMRQHNNANAIAFGTNYCTEEDVYRRINIFLTTEFEGGRHERRVDLIEKIK